MTQKQRILALLMSARFVPSHDLARHNLQYNARIFELRRKGIEIERMQIPGHYGKIDGYRLTTPKDKIDFENCRVR